MSNHPAVEKGRTAVVTGAASGIGLAAAERFLSHGMNVVMADINGEMLSAEADRLRQAGHDGTVMAVETDVSKPQDLESLRQNADFIRRCGYPDEQCRHRIGRQGVGGQ